MCREDQLLAGDVAHARLASGVAEDELRDVGLTLRGGDPGATPIPVVTVLSVWGMLWHCWAAWRSRPFSASCAA
jgi:hypothetical protein